MMSASSSRFGSGRRSISDDSAHSKTSANQSDPPGQSAGNTFNSKHIVQATHQALVLALSLRSSADIAIATADRAEADAARALSRAPAVRALSDQTNAAAVLRSRAVDAVAAADRAQTETAELRAGAGAGVGAGSGGSKKVDEASLRAAEQRSKANEAVAAAERAEAEVAVALAAIKVAHEAQARAETLRASANEAAVAAERAEIEARWAKAIAQAAAESAKLGASINEAEAKSTKARAELESTKAAAENIKAQVESATIQAVGQMKSCIAQNTRLWFQYGSLLFLGATGVLLIDYLWTENAYVAGVRLFFKMRKVTEPQRFDNDLVNREDLWRGGNCLKRGILMPDVVIGYEGVGKSALLRRFVKEQPHCIYIGLRGLDGGDDGSCAKQTESSRDLSSICDVMMQQFGFPDRRSLFSVLFSDVSNATVEVGVTQLESTQLVEASSKWVRSWSAFDSALGLFKWWCPDRFVTVVFDEVTFLAPANDDSKERATFKKNLFKLLEIRAVKSGHDVLDARFIFATSSPKLGVIFNRNKFNFSKVLTMSVEEMGTVIAAASISALSPSDPNQSKDQAAVIAESKSMVSRRALTQIEGEYLAKTFGSIRTGIYFSQSDEFQELREDDSASAFHNAVSRYRQNLVEKRLFACNAVLRPMLLPEVEAKGGMDTLARVVAAFREGVQQSQASANALHCPIQLNACDPVVFGVFANLHEKSVLFLDGANRAVTFPYPEGWEAFDLAMKHFAPLVSAASVEK